MSTSRTREKADKLTYTQAEVTAGDTAARAGRKNLIINGGFDVWQRGTSFTPVVNETYTADRWFSYRSLTSLSTITKRTDATGVPFINYIRGDNSIDSNTTWYQLTQRIEDYQHLLSKTVTLSFYIRASQSVSDMRIATNAGVTSSLFALTTNWVKQEITLALGTGTVVSNGYLEIKLDKTTSEMPANTSIDVAQVQLELGSVATDFEHRSYGEELQLCQRFYQKTDTFAHFNLTRYKGNSGNAYNSFKLACTMRSTPTFSQGGTWTASSNAGYAGTPVVSDIFKDSVTIRSDNTMGSNECVYLSSGYLMFDAEL